MAAGCGGGSGSGGGAQEVPVEIGGTGPGDPGDYAPLGIGNYWHFQGSTNSQTSPSPYHGNLAVIDTELIDGYTTQVLNESASNQASPFNTYLLPDPNGLINFGSSSPNDPLSRGIKPYWELRYPLNVGSSFLQIDRENLDYGEDLDGDFANERVDVESQVTVEKKESLQVPAGNFSEVLRLRRDIDLTLHLSRGGTATANSTETLWLAPQVGWIKRHTVVSSENISETFAEELDAYSVDGTSIGITALQTGDVRREILTAGTKHAYSFPATPGLAQVVVITGVDGNPDLIPYLPTNCQWPDYTQNGSGEAESCQVAPIADRLYVGVEALTDSTFTVLSGGLPTGTGAPISEGTSATPIQITPDKLIEGQVATRGRSYYAVTGLTMGSHTVLITGLDSDADLKVYSGETYSFELDCTLRAPGDVGTDPSQCTIPNTDRVYFSVACGELNRDGARFLMAVSN